MALCHIDVWVMMPKNVWIMWYGRVMGYGFEITANQLGILKKACVITKYGLYPVLIISESTVVWNNNGIIIDLYATMVKGTLSRCCHALTWAAVG